MREKLNGSQGETLVEVLASILIGALSVALLFPAVMASVNMDRTAKKVDGEFQIILKAAEERDAAAGTSGQVTVKYGAVSESVSVTFYGGKGARSYALAP